MLMRTCRNVSKHVLFLIILMLSGNCALPQNGIIISDSLYCILWNTFEKEGFHSAITLGEKAVKIRENTFGHPDTTCANILNDMSIISIQSNHLMKANKYAKESQLIRQKILGENHKDHIASLTLLGIINQEMGRLEDAHDYFSLAINYSADSYMTDTVEYLQLLSFAIYNAFSIRQFDDVIIWSNYYLLCDNRILAKVEKDASNSLLFGASALKYFKRYEESITYLEKAIQLAQPENASILYNLMGENYMLLEDYESSVYYYTKSNNSLNDTSDISLMTAIYIGLFLSSEGNGNYYAALRNARKMSSYILKQYGKNSKEYVVSLHSLAECYLIISQYDSARTCFMEMLQFVENNHQFVDDTIAAWLMAASLACAETEMYGEAIYYGSVALEYFQKKYSSYYFEMMYALAEYYYMFSNEDESYKLFKQLKQELEKRKESGSDMYLTCLFRLSLLERNSEEKNKYKIMIQNIIDTINDTHLEEDIFNDLFNYYLANEQYGEIYIMLNKPEMVLFDDSATYYHYCGIYYSAIGNLNEAIDNWEKCLNTAGEKNNYDRVYLDAHKRLLLAYVIGDKLINVEMLFDQTKKYVEFMKDNLPYVQDNKREKTIQDFTEIFEPALQFFVREHQADSIIEYGLNDIIYSKGILLETDVSMRESILQAKDSVLDSLYFLVRKNENSKNQNSNDIIVLKGKILTKLKEQYNIRVIPSYDWKEISMKLSENEAAIEFCFFSLNDSNYYSAYIIKGNDSLPHFVAWKPLPKTIDVNSLNGSKWLWNKMDTVLRGVKTIFFSPAGELYNLAIESLPDYEDSTRLISDRYNLYRLSSTRELAKDKKKTTIKNGSVYGGLHYDAKIDTTLRGTDGSRSFTYYPWAADSTTIGTRGNLPTYLPNTLTEAQYIGDLMSRTSIKHHVYTGGEGDEASFKRLSGSNANLLHIATHGFYYEGTQEVKQNIESVVGEDKSMTRSGLLFAGVNTTLNSQHSSGNTYNDGILTAQEIAQLDLENVDMAVLSACETGLGELKGDGVFGLQRGFKKAGVNSIIMSLWKVDDRATQMLMTQFYENWLIKKMPKQKALKEAQEYVRNFEIDELEWAVELRKQKKQRGGGGNFRTHATGKSKTNKTSSGRTIKPFQDPKYWAAFILLDGLD